jgi:hypothetical protein
MTPRKAEVLALMDKHPNLRSNHIAKMVGISTEQAACIARRAGRPFLRKPRPGWQRPIPIPEHAHPLVREFIGLSNNYQTTLKEIAERAGCSPWTLSSWKCRHMPLLDAFEAALNVLDYELVIRRRPE